MGPSQRREIGLHSFGGPHRERIYRGFQRSAPSGVPESELVLLSGGCEDQDRGWADGLQRTPSAYVPGQSNAGAIRVGMAAIPDREGGNILNLRLDQRWGEAHRRESTRPVGLKTGRDQNGGEE